MVQVHDLYVGMQHGEDCTCRKLDPITTTPVLVDPACPGLDGDVVCREARQPVEHAGRIVITWPTPAREGVPLFSWNMRFHDYDTGEELTAITGLHINLGGKNWTGEAVTADLTMLVNADGQPLRDGEPVHPVFAGDTGIATAVFRYEVMEMRVATPEESKR